MRNIAASFGLRPLRTAIFLIMPCVLLLNKCVHGTLSSYLDIHLAVNHDRHLLNTRCTGFYAICPKYYTGTDSGPTFLVSAATLRNNVPLSTRKVDSVTCFYVGSVVVSNICLSAYENGYVRTIGRPYRYDSVCCYLCPIFAGFEKILFRFMTLL